MPQPGGRSWTALGPGPHHHPVSMDHCDASKRHPSLHRSRSRDGGAPGPSPALGPPHSPLSPCGQPRHARRAHRRLPTHRKARGEGGCQQGLPAQVGGQGLRAGGTYRHTGLSRGAGLAQLSSSALQGKEGRVARQPGCLSLGPGLRPALPGEGSHVPVLPSRPWTLLVPGDPVGQRAEVRGQSHHIPESTPKGCGALAASLAWMPKPHSGTHGGSPALEHPGAPSQAPLRGTGTHR